MRSLSTISALLLVTACSSGGGGGSPAPTPTPTPTNTAPSFTSGATASVVENTTAAYQAAATDAEGNPITFTIAGGADAARFAITAAGALSFVAAPNFEAPADADADNVYQVQLRASDGTLSSTRDLAVTVTNSREGIAVKRVGTGFTQPVMVSAIPNDSRVIVTEKGGGIWLLDPATGAKTLLTTITGLSTDGERGLLGLAVQPQLGQGVQPQAGTATDGPFFIHRTVTDGTIVISRIARNGTSWPQIDIVSIPHPTNNNHNGGWLGFGPDGNLYVGIGDGGGGGDPSNNAQNPNSRLGKILRIAPNPDPYAGAAPSYYMPAPGNPYIAGGGDPWVFAIGLRNPFRNSFGPDGRLYIGDVGEGAIEEVNVARPNQPGLNFGWKFLEGTNPFSGTAPAGLTAPVTQYTHGSGPKQGASIIGGYVYRGPVTSLQGSYVFGDFVSGNIWTVPAASLVQGQLFASTNYERRNLDFTPDAGTINSLSSFGEDSAGNLYLVDIGGSIFMIQPG
ncbi:glucose/arabinose dehydrogenase [Sphingomonas kyeonggiensis]|uniref:Glucose/arabinose dehydrogenase n=1 Tax=Sphingomonas kyeonggiensis TaxID=1268553 RepID=A0A7W7K3M3_9SPHN|nr:PQQ-dependent sugar dehydrogenase [Sphingomonas kyeonggiensis]MBB4840449.1 glucose/arabinose dehydrogenase [Sphingomonas kyeonggiensis]